MMSTEEAKKYLSSVQDLLVPMGLNAKLAGELSNEVVKLSADLGSFNNLETVQVMDDIQSALVGNFETMKKYGIVLNATVVQQKALDMGLAETKGALTAGMKAQAAYNLMVEGSAAAIGDAQKTAGGYANQVKKLRSQIKDISATIGNQFLPLATEVVKTMNEMAAAYKGTLGGKFASVMKVALTGMQAFHNAWLGVKLVGQVAVITLSHQLSALYVVLKNTMLQPLNLVSKLLVKLGAIDANPFDAMSKGLANFRESSKAVAKDILSDMSKTNATYDRWRASIGAAEEEMVKLGNTTKTVAEETTEVIRFSAAERMKLEKQFSEDLLKARVGETEFNRLQLEQRKEDMIAIGFTMQEANEAFAERFKELEQEKTLASQDFMAGVGVGFETLAERTKTFAMVGKEAVDTLFFGAVSGIGKAAAAALFEGENLGKNMAKVMKNAAKNIVANLITVGIQRTLLKLLNLESTLSEHIARTAALASETFSGAYAATVAIPIVGPALAPGVAAASLATMLSGQAAAGKAGAAAGAAGIAHGGLDSVPREQTFLLDRGERVLSRSQNEDLTEFLANGGRSANVTFNITAFDSYTMTDTVRTTIIPMLQDALELNSEDFRDSIQRAVA